MITLCLIFRVAIPVYGYESPVRVCSHCYSLLNEEVLCDFDEANIDIDQWNSVHLQNESNTHNLGKSSSFFNKYARSSDRHSETTSTSKSRSEMSESSCASSAPPSISREASERASIHSCTGYDSESTLSNNSDQSEDDQFVERESKQAVRHWKNINIQNLFKNNPLSRNNSFKRKSPSRSHPS